MLNDEICKKRDELNKSIENNDDYDKIYKISVELDELITKYYMEKTTYEETKLNKTTYKGNKTKKSKKSITKK